MCHLFFHILHHFTYITSLLFQLLCCSYYQVGSKFVSGFISCLNYVILSGVCRSDYLFCAQSNSYLLMSRTVGYRFLVVAIQCTLWLCGWLSVHSTCIGDGDVKVVNNYDDDDDGDDDDGANLHCVFAVLPNVMVNRKMVCRF